MHEINQKLSVWSMTLIQKSRGSCLTLLIAVTMIAFAQPIKADTEQKRIQLALDVLRVTDNEAVIKTIVTTLMIQIKKIVTQRNPGHEKRVEELMNRAADKMVKRRKDLHDDLAKVYAQQFTADELKQLLEFYRAPLGKKFLSKMPIITQESVKLGQQWGRTVAIEVLNSVELELKSSAN